MFTPAMATLHDGPTVTFGETTSADIRATDIDIREGRPHFELVTPAGRASVGLRLVGIHQVANALAAAAIATNLNISIDVIAGALSTAELNSKWRMEIHELAGLVLINDSYNASPESTEAALRTLVLFAQERGGQSWAFLGKMHELGASTGELHARLGTLASELGIDHLVCISAAEYVKDLNGVSTGATSSTVHLFDSKESAAELVSQMAEGDVVLVKASRAEKFEDLAEMITERWNIRENGGED
jgi:UDP-N-acetylmuramoyl-tripeptide--D-alanyl-D-alanine ligase